MAIDYLERSDKARIEFCGFTHFLEASSQVPGVQHYHITDIVFGFLSTMAVSVPCLDRFSCQSVVLRDFNSIINSLLDLLEVVSNSGVGSIDRGVQAWE